MADVVAELVPLALAVAASPFPIIPAILLLFTGRARANGLGFLAGWVLGIAAATGLFIALAAVIESRDEPPGWLSWVKIVLGAALLVVGLLRLRDRSAQQQVPGWMQSIDESTPGTALRLGVVLSAANPKILLLTAAAGLTIGAAELAAGAIAASAVVFIVLASSTVALPVLSYVILGERMLGPLGRARSWLQRNNALVMALVFIVIGILLVANGVAGL